MKPALVTGASGFLGWHVARVLLERGYRVRALVRPGSRVDALDVEPRRPATCATPHPWSARSPAAAWSSTWRPITACGPRIRASFTAPMWMARAICWRPRASAGVERVVYTSTVGCIGIPHDGIGDETIAGQPRRHGRRLQTLQVSGRAGGAGIRPLRLPGGDGQPHRARSGDHDVKPTPTGKIVVDFLNGDMPAFIDTGLNVVDVRDTAEGHWLACERGRVGERYILGSENLTLAQILQTLARLTDRKAAHHPAALRGGVLRRRLQHRLGEPHRHAAARAAECCPDGAQENVGHARKGPPRTGLQPRLRRTGAGARRRVVRRPASRFRVNARITSHWLTRRCGARTPACRVGNSYRRPHFQDAEWSSGDFCVGA